MDVVKMLQNQFQEAATNLQKVQGDYSKVLADRQTLDSQLNENRQVGDMWTSADATVICDYVIKSFRDNTQESSHSIHVQVKEELDLAGDDTKVFKLIGPALVNQDLTEAKGNVEKRIEYIR